MSEVQLPLLDLFLRLREADFPLGIGEYQTLVRAMQMGFGSTDYEALRRLCCTLWVKSTEEKRLFDYIFDIVRCEQEVVRARARAQAQAPSTPQQEADASLPQGAVQKDETDQAIMGDSTQQDLVNMLTPRPSTTDTPIAVSAADFVPVISGEIALAQAMQSALASSDLLTQRFLLASEYFPVTRRQMKRSWRYLRRMVREGRADHFNIEATVKKLGNDGVLLEPVLEPQRINHTELLMAIDQEGSMVPFHGLSRRLVETALRGGRLGKAGVYYFHNCPLEYLYLAPELVEAKNIKEICASTHQEYAVALIFSDAGAARGGLNEERVKLTEAFLNVMKSRFRHIAWLNPMPESRWSGTTAANIARIVPMFELSRRGMDGAIDVLRGRYSAVRKGFYG